MATIPNCAANLTPAQPVGRRRWRVLGLLALLALAALAAQASGIEPRPSGLLQPGTGLGRACGLLWRAGVLPWWRGRGERRHRGLPPGPS